MRGYARLNNLNLLRGDPNVDLLKTSFQGLFVGLEECSRLSVDSIYTNP